MIARLWPQKLRSCFFALSSHNTRCMKILPETRTFHTSPENRLTKKEKFQAAVKEYGKTFVVFHVAISLASLGGFYTAISSGIDVLQILQNVPMVGDKIANLEYGKEASTFILAYAVHKVFAPLRISASLSCTPIIVHYIRKRI